MVNQKLEGVNRSRNIVGRLPYLVDWRRVCMFGAKDIRTEIESVYWKVYFVLDLSSEEAPVVSWALLKCESLQMKNQNV